MGCGQVSIILLSLMATCTGLNITEANHVVMVDSWWNPTVEDQAVDRSHRIGQKKPVTVVRFVAEDSVELKILDLQVITGFEIACIFVNGNM